MKYIIAESPYEIWYFTDIEHCAMFFKTEPHRIQAVIDGYFNTYREFNISYVDAEPFPMYINPKCSYNNDEYEEESIDIDIIGDNLQVYSDGNIMLDIPIKRCNF